MTIRQLLAACAASIAFAGGAVAHGGGVAHQKPIQIAPDADWATKHMAEEHHISTFDPASFFSLHDYDNSGSWEQNEILKTYGMDDPSAKDVPQEKKDEIIREVMKLMDHNSNGIVEKHEWLWFTGEERKGTLPDFGLGPGHHWDMETEYEIHHWELYHDENTKEEDLIHPEDIEHFRLHDELEDEAERVAALDKLSIVEQNIPAKFRRD